MSRKIFVNIAVADLPQSMEFFRALGLGFDPKFTDDKAACMLINDDAYVMLLSDPFFRSFTRRQPADTSKVTEAMLALSCESRADVDAMVKTAVAAGGSHAMDPQDYGFMYGWSFYDLDGHHWEVMSMDAQAVQ